MRDIIIVSGLPRSGTSMLMHMLKAGGLGVLTDDQRTADEDNPKGYYEFEKVKRLERDKEWVSDAIGKGIKIVSPLLKYLPEVYAYKILFMLRDTQEVLASQKQMLIRRAEPKLLTDEETVKLWDNHLAEIQSWLRDRSNFDVLYLDYHDMIKEPKRFSGVINRFLGNQLDEAKMATVVDTSLYRQRVQKP